MMTNEHDHQRKPSDHENMQVPLHLNARRVPRTTGQSFQGMAKKIFKIVRGGNTIPISNDSSSGNHLTSLYIHAASLCRHPFSVIVSKLPATLITTSKVPGRCPWIQWMGNSITFKKRMTKCTFRPKIQRNYNCVIF